MPVPLSLRTSSPKDLGAKILIPIVNLVANLVVNTLSSKRLDAKRHYVILAQAAVGASAQHCTGMTNWPNTIQCLGSDDIMSLGIKSSAFQRVQHPFSCKFEVQIFLTCFQLVGTLGKSFFRNFLIDFLTCSQLVGMYRTNILKDSVPG